MAQFSQEIYKITTKALADLEQSQKNGRTPLTPLNVAHYIAAWLTTSIKNKDFDQCAVETLKSWQNQARSLGKNANLKSKFESLVSSYKKAGIDKKQPTDVYSTQFLSLFQKLEQLDWLVTTESEIGERFNRHSGGKASLIVCASELSNNFDENGVLQKPVSLFVRGELQVIVNEAFALDLLMYKTASKKSKVKYHVEYIIEPNNDGKVLPELFLEQI